MPEHIVYRGGQHSILCDGRTHWIKDKWGTRKDGPCWCSVKVFA